MKRRTQAVVCFAVAAALVALTGYVQRGAADDHPRSLAERLLGPIAELAAALQWVRVDAALDRGRPDLAEARAELALELAPGYPEGWIYYADHLIYDRASRVREPDPAARERWVRAGLALLERGERESRAPGRMAFKRGVVFLSFAQIDEDADRPLPITRQQAWLEAADAFDRAAQAGEPLALEAAEAVRREAGQ